MKYFKYIKNVFLVLFCAATLTTSTVYLDKANAEPAKAATVAQQVIQVSPLAVVNSPKTYLNKQIVMYAKFDKFATLGLDYKPAFRSSEDYISFLIQREDSTHNIPLSEMKLFLKRNIAEKFIDLKTDDEVKIEGIVFSDALGDPWVDVKTLTITKKSAEEEKK